ncbi:LysR family transcriptional regulator [Paracandidimonas soli]|uniref:LysR family transcriptional regulator n=1 Tax=Paracandidimonas soli TaxID=1917182 RepID=UPI00360D6411
MRRGDRKPGQGGRTPGDIQRNHLRHVSDLEEALGCRLFQRTTRKLRLTESGMLCLERLTRSLDEIDELTQLIQAENNQPRGTLRISSTTQFWVRKIAPVLSSFLRQHRS